MRLQDYLSEKKALIEHKLSELLPIYGDIPVVHEAMSYSLFAGGKRIRPILALMACELLEGNTDEVIPFACSIEMIHTYSLIHDDLPAMDDDDFRRGKPTSHKVYGEAFAVLAGDALLNCAFEIMLDFISSNNKKEYVEAARLVGKASGVDGMIGGQCIDIYYEGKVIDIELLKKMHAKKTGAMLAVPLAVGAVIAGGSREDISRMQEYGRLIGLAFQITDDILDVEGTSEKLGKSIGSDENNNKCTFVTLYGLNESKKIAKELVRQAKELLGVYGDKSMVFRELADYIVDRDS